MFPSNNYIPKKDIQQEDFLQKYPEYDGRGILIAVIDTGFDVSMPGMQKTSSDLPKIVDCFDFTGDGIIYTSKNKEADENNILVGLSGRKLKVPQKWKNPSRKWRLGKILYSQICPNENEENLKEEQNEREDEKENIKITDDKSKLFLDCIIWNDGEKWRACLDTSFSGDLENEKFLTNFCDEHEYGIISNKFGYCVSIQNDGKIVEILATHCKHGSMVAHVAAAYFPEELNRNGDGLAPGSQVVLMKVFGLSVKNRSKLIEKALLKCIEMKVNVVNLSILMAEKVSKIINEMVEKHGIIVVNAAGNLGPVYSSIKTTDVNYSGAVLRIGSVLTPEIYQAFYGLEKANNGNSITVFPYSSKGPSNRGARGISFTAPGAVKVQNPKWCQKNDEIIYGTSFAAPIVTGSIACLLSALKANSIKYSPALIKLALSNTAYLPESGDKLEFGEGIIQIKDAFDFITKSLKDISLCSLSQISLTCAKAKNGILFIKKRSESNFKALLFLCKISNKKYFLDAKINNI